MMTTELTHKVDYALHAVDAFTTLIEQENAVLAASDFSAFEAMQDDKMVLAQHYQQAILSFEEDVDVLKSIDEPVKEKLRSAHTRFTKAAEANETILLATKNVSERIVTMIMNAARRSVAEGPNYGATGTQGLSDKIPVHFKINEVL